MAKLFSKSKLKEVAQNIKTDDILEHVAIIKKWNDDYHQGTLKTDKETSREQAYNQDIFINILGYKEKPAKPHSFEPKATTQAGQLPDAIIGYLEDIAEKEDTRVSAVIELKGAAIALDKPQRRDGNMSPVQQGFKYKTQYKNCPFVVVSNFYEFRLYQDNQLDYEVWTLDDLVDESNDYLNFKTFYALMHYDNFVPSEGKGKSKTEELLSDIRTEQEEIGKKFYKDYKAARLALLRNIYKNNPHIKDNIDLGIEKAQKIIDRIVFACFAEDRGLLPDNTLARVLKVDESAFGGLWDTLKGFFNAIDTGSAKLEVPQGYNGGLFASDTDLNDLKIDDEPLKDLALLGSYDFKEQLSVQILGHIFEQSISDLEEIKQKAEEAVGKETEKTSGKRKKDGIFYTPDYIVKYIVENSLGAYLKEAEEKCKQEAGLKGDINDKNYSKREHEAYMKYQKILQEVTVCDPACGSGAFLVYVFDYLLAENKRVAAIINPEQGGLFETDAHFKSILENNIYGVDLNQESVEITKLSLWLKSAQKGKKLTTLDSNIKCGNSLIDDPEVAGDKAFDWQKEFPQIFEKGGFDVVVGNPPYGAEMSENTHDYLRENYKSTKYKYESYSLFMELALSILARSGYTSYIVPYTWMTIQQHSELRKIFSNVDLVRILDLPTKVFADADLDTVIFVACNRNVSREMLVDKMDEDQNITTFKVSADANEKQNAETININVSDKDRPIINKIKINSRLGERFKVSQGYIPYRRSDLVKEYGVDKGNATVDQRLWHSEKPVDGTYKREVSGRDLSRFNLYLSSSSYVKYGKHVASYVDEKFFTSPRILIMEVTRGKKYKITASFTEVELYNTPSIINVIHPVDNTKDLLSLLALLNSSLMSWYHGKVNPKANAKTSIPKILIADVRSLPLANSSEELIKLSRKEIETRSEFNISSHNFKNIILSEHHDVVFSGKNEFWWKLDFTEFTKALKVKLTLQQKDELLQLFEKYQKELLELDEKIQKTDHEIDQLVYQLYDLTPEEIKIVEEATK